MSGLFLAFMMLTITALVGIVWLRALSSHSRKMSATQARLNRRTGNQTSDEVPLPRVNASMWTRKNIWAVLLALVGGCFLWWLYNTDVHMVVLSDWAWGHWAFVLVAATVVAWALAKFAKVSATAVCGLVIGVLVLFIAGPIETRWNAKEKEPPPPSEAILAPGLFAEQLKLTVAAGSKSERILLPFGMHHMRVYGTKYRLYTIYQDGTECSSFGKETCPDGSIAYFYVQNEMPREDIISYAFVPK